MKTIVDTSLLISLAKIDCLEILAKFKGDLFIPDEVYEESVKEGEKKNLPDAALIKRFIDENTIAIVKVKSSSVRTLFSLIKKSLPRGDRAVLSLALQEGAKEIMTDDEGLGKIALYLGVDVISSPDLLLRSLKNGVIQFQEFEQFIRRLVLKNRLGAVVSEFYFMEGKRYVKD